MGNKSVDKMIAVLYAASVVLGSIARGQTVAAVESAVAAKQQLVTVDVVNVPLANVLESIARQSGLSLFWNEAVSGSTARVTMHFRAVPTDEAFAKALVGTGLRASISSSTVAFVKEEGVGATSGEITGVVVDAKTRRPVRGASVLLDGATKGVLTGDDGRFRLGNVVAGAHTVRVRLLGYAKAGKSVQVVDGGMASVEVVLEPSVNALEQVVVTGTVVATELKAVPNAITVITAKELEERGIRRIDELFRGDVPGLFAKRLGAAGIGWTDVGIPGSADVSARGSTSLNSSDETIKIYVDGVELANRAYLGLIDPTAIERIEILTGPQASTIYGSNAINGVMQVFTKRGASARPQLTAEARSAWTQNNLNSAVAPKHVADLSLSGVDGRMSYNVGGSWEYTGSWTPGVQEQTLSGFAGERMTFGRLTLDGNLRVLRDGNLSRAAGDIRPEIEGILFGNGDQVIGAGSAPVINRGTSTDRAFGATGAYALTSWWSHTVTLGVDQLATLYNSLGKAYSYPSDTTSYLSGGTTNRLTAAYTTTMQVPLTSIANVVVTVGGDESHTTGNSVFGSYVLVNGAYQPDIFNPWHYARSQVYEHGGFLQSQVGVWDALFFTYGLRAVYNPNIGADQNPHWEPRYGVAYSHDIAGVTAKLRASYGTATRPPALGKKDQLRLTSKGAIKEYGDTMYYFANPNLLPEQQRGGEGGLELYLGNRASVTVTRFNQTVNDLIVNTIVDSIDALPAYRAAEGLRPWEDPLHQHQYLNIGSVRNQGWEMTGTLTAGVLTTTGTYSWTKSRLIGVTPRYRGLFPQYVVGAPFNFRPEHTYALGLAYVHGGTRISYNVQGQGAWQSLGDFFWDRTGNTYATRLPTYNSRVALPRSFTEIRRGYQLGDVNVSQQVTRHIEALVQINNVTNSYQSELDPYTMQAGRTTGVGLRLRW